MASAQEMFEEGKKRRKKGWRKREMKGRQECELSAKKKNGLILQRHILTVGPWVHSLTLLDVGKIISLFGPWFSHLKNGKWANKVVGKILS